MYMKNIIFSISITFCYVLETFYRRTEEQERFM